MLGTTSRGAAHSEKLQPTVRGEVIAPEHAGYEQACQVHNAMIQKRPALIARCADAGDVMIAVRFGRAEGLDIAVRGGGHNGGGLGIVDDGLVLDLSHVNQNIRPAAGS